MLIWPRDHVWLLAWSFMGPAPACPEGLVQIGASNQSTLNPT